MIVTCADEKLDCDGCGFGFQKKSSFGFGRDCGKEFQRFLSADQPSAMATHPNIQLYYVNEYVGDIDEEDDNDSDNDLANGLALAILMIMMMRFATMILVLYDYDDDDGGGN